MEYFVSREKSESSPSVYLLFLFACLLSVHYGLGQTSGSNQISTSEKIEKTRKRLLDAVIEDNLTNISILYQALSKLDDENYLAIYPGEEWLIGYWLRDYQVILDGIGAYDSAFLTTNGMRVQPSGDYLIYKLKEKIDTRVSELKSQIQTSSYSEEQKDFLALNLDYLLYSGDNQEQLNSSANSFLKNHPNSEYEDYIREYVRYEFKPSKWGFSFEFFSGYGVFTEDLSRDFTNNVPIGIAFDVFYKKYVLFLRNYIGFSRTTNAIEFDGGTWQEDAQVRVFLPEASVGYTLVDSKRIKFMPFVGISSTSVSPTEYDRNRIEEYDKVGLDFTTTYSFGLNMDLVLGKSGSVPIISWNEEAYWFIRLRYSYNQPQFNKKYEGFEGNFHYITFGFGGFGRKLKRDY
ncbi:MAG: hypothetical protein AAF616_05150 [Bacteroidota bacterium]